MPVFRINIVFNNGKQYKGHHLVDGVELDNYYRHLYRFAQRVSIPIKAFDVVQVSELSSIATFMRKNNIKRMSPHVPNVQPVYRPTYRRRRF